MIGERAVSDPPALRGKALWCVTRKYPPQRGGMELLSFELTTRIAQRRPTRIIAKPARRFALPGFVIATALRLLAGCARARVAVLHLGDPVLAPLAIVAKVFGVPTVVTIHGLDVTYRHPLYRLWLRLFLRRLDAYVCISDTARSAAVERGVPMDRISVIGVGIDTAPIPTREVRREDDLLLFVGRLVRRKGLAWFVGSVLPALAAERPRLRLAVLGDGPERQSVIDIATRARVLDRVELLGSADDTRKWEWYARATACVMPNVRIEGDIEGFGIVALEAMAAGCTLIVSDIEGPAEAIAGSPAQPVPASDADAWCTAVARLLDDAQLRSRIGEEAKRWVKSARNWDTVVDRYDALFTRLAAGRAP